MLSRYLTAIVFAIAVSTSSTACAAQSGGSAGDGPDAAPAESQAGPSSQSSDASISGRKPRLVKVANFSQPVEIKAAPGVQDLMYVVEQEGRIMVLRKGKKLRKPFLNITGKVEYGGERGLLSVAFPPDFKKSKRFYVYFTDGTGDIRVDEFKARTAVRARANSGRRVITIPHRENSNHNGGQLQFLGNDLYFGTGDGGGGGDEPGNAQNRDVLLGKMIRIDPRATGGRPYSVPASNPFVGRDGRDEIYSLGLRNPFRWSFQKSGGVTRMMIADVGQDEFEEINSVAVGQANGANFGWNRFEGFAEFEGSIGGTTKPALVLPHSQGNCSVIGGLIVRDPKVPALRGRYIYTDFCKSAIRSFRPGPGRVRSTRATGISEGQISSFAQSASKRVYATSLSGPVFRLTQ